MNKVKSYCDNCIHKEVCGKEGCGDPAMVFCDDMITEAIPFEWIREWQTQHTLIAGYVNYMLLDWEERK